MIREIQAGEFAVVFLGRLVIRAGGVELVIEVAEVVGFVLEADGCRPFLGSFAPVDAFVFRACPGGPAGVSAVLGEGAQAQVLLSVVQAVMVDVVHNQVVRGLHDLAVHLDALAAGFSGGVAILARPFREPGILAQARIVLGIDDGEFAPRQRDQARRAAAGAGGPRGVKARARIKRRTDRPAAFGAFFLAADQGGPAGTDGEGRKAAIVAPGPGHPVVFFVGHKRRSGRQKSARRSQQACLQAQISTILPPRSCIIL